MRQFEIPGKPIGKGRPRACARGKFVRMYTPERTVSYEGKVAMAYRAAHPGAPPFPAGMPLAVTVDAWFAVPASWSKKRKAAAYWHTGKPDGDNLLKAICDALNGIAWHDDSQVVMSVVTKGYTEAGERVAVCIGVLEPSR